MRSRPLFSATPAVSLPLLALALAAHAALKSLFFSRLYMTVALSLESATDGLITTVTLAGLLSWLVLGGIVVGLGRLRAAHVGLTWTALREAVPVLTGLWLVSQVIQAALASGSGPVAIAPFSDGVAPALGQRLQAVVGSGLLEETIYRGFLLVQVYALLRTRLGRDQAVAWALVISSVYFGLNHIPAGLRGGLSPIEAAGFAVYSGLVGGMFAVLYLRTGNLFVAAGAHALINDPLPLFTAVVDPSVVVLSVAAGLMLTWPALARRYRFTIGTVEGTPAL